ncbi:hypothetical protein D3C87_1262350 [compost metagenome]
MGYDITEQQPQLFVTPDFKTLVNVLHEMADGMAYKIGGLKGIQKAIEAKSVNTAELDSGLQISGQVVESITADDGSIAYLRVQGPSQLSYQDKELPGHDKGYHAHGFGTPVGFLKDYPDRSPSTLTASEWAFINVEPGKAAKLEFESGVVVTGKVQKRLVQDGKTLLLTLTDAKAEYKDRILFDPSWGAFDMALGSTITSVFGGPADRIAYGETTDFVAKRVPAPKYSENELKLHKQYQTLRTLREEKVSGAKLEAEIEKLISIHDRDFSQDWLLRLEALELLNPQSALYKKLNADLEALKKLGTETKGMIEDGLKLLGT